MAKKPIDSAKKRRTRSHVISDLAVNHVERLALLSGYTMQRITHDYGLDASLTTYDARGGVENGVVWMQFKASDRPLRAGDGSLVAVRVERKDLLYWMGELYPVVVVLYDASADLAYWLHVQHEYSGGRLFELDRAGVSVTLHISKECVLTVAVMREIRRLKTLALNQWKKGASTND